MEKKERIYNIDFLRFIGAIAIVLYHFFMPKEINSLNIPFFSTMKNNVLFAGIWVEYFFIISGFFLFTTTNFQMKFLDFFKKKILRLLPAILFGLLLYKILSSFGILTTFRPENIFTMLLLNNVGFTTASAMGNLSCVWYVSALFWAMMALFYLYKLLPKQWMNFIMGVTIFFCYTFLINTTFFAPKVYFNFINCGMLRAFGGLAIGYFIAELYKNHEAKKQDTLTKLFISTAQIYLFSFIIYNTMLHKFSNSNRLLLIIAFIPLLLTFVTKQGYLAQVLDTKVSSILGRYSYSIYVTHLIVLNYCKYNLSKNNPAWIAAHPYECFIITIITVICLGVVTYHLVEQPAARYLNKFCFSPRTERERERERE